MDFSAVCRLCLSTSNLNPIFDNNSDSEHYSTAISITAGINVKINDGLPQKICSECIANINSNLLFRKLSKETEQELFKGQTGVANDGDTKLEITIDGNKADDFNYITIDLLPKVNEFKEECSDELKDMKVEALEFDDDGVMCDASFEASDKPDDDEKPLKYLLETENLEAKDIKEDTGESKPSKPPRVTCSVCGKELAYRSLRGHMRRTHAHTTPEDTNSCEFCGEQCDSKSSLKEHLSTCKLRKPVKRQRKPNANDREQAQCMECGRVMLRASLRAHRDIAHRGAGKVCEHCGKRFHNKHRLLEHGRARHGHEKLRCPRPQCGFTTAGLLAMQVRQIKTNHERRHLGERPFVCERCGAAFHARYLLAQHTQSHRPEKTLKCGSCPAVFRAGNALHMHRLAVHSRARVRCASCARTFSCRHYAVKHLRLFHKFKGTVPQLEVIEGAPEEDDQKEIDDK